MGYEAYVAAQKAESLSVRYTEALGRLKGLLPGDRRTLYDVGAGAGAFLAQARQMGFEATGNDISPDAVRLAEQTHGIKLSTKELRDEIGRDRYDAMTMWCVLAHVDDPRALLSDVHRLLKPGGVLYFHTPRWCLIDVVGLAALRISGGRLDNLTARRMSRAHRRLYSTENLSQLLGSVGFVDLEVRPKAGYSLHTVAYLNSIRVPSSLVAPVAAILDRLIGSALAPRNILDVYVKK